MPVNNFNIETYNTEFLRSYTDWEGEFAESLKKIKEQQRYDEVWEKIKKKNNL